MSGDTPITSSLWDTLKAHLRLTGMAMGRFFTDGGLALAGNMAFLGMLAFFPFLIFLVALSGFIGQTDLGTQAIEFMLENMPEEVADTIRRPIASIRDNTRGDILTVSILFALWSAATGVEAARTAVIRAYGKEYGKPIWRARAESLVVVILAAIMIFVTMGLLVVGPAVLEAIDTFIPLPQDIQELWSLFRFGLTPAILFLALYAFYFALVPRREFPRQFRAPGTLLCLVIWMLVAGGFSLYLQHLGRFSVTYGSLAGVIIAQIFFYVLSIGFIMGAYLNAVYAHYHKSREERDTGSQD